MERAALSLAAAAVSPILTKLGCAAASYFGGDISPEELRHLQTNILPKIQTVIEQAERIDSPQLKPWLMDLQASAYEAEDTLDLYEYKRIKNEVSPPTSLQKFKAKAKEKLAPVLPKTALKRSFERLTQSAAEADKFTPLLSLVNSINTTQDDTTMKRRQQPTTVSGLLAPVFGRGEECNALVNMLITEPPESSSNRNVTLHAIHGIGGAGKTTLAQQVYNDARVGDHFDSRLWVHVSRTFDTYRITKEIIEAVENGSSSPVGNLDTIQKKLREALKSKRFLLVLDDVWTEDRHSWDQLLVPLCQDGEAGSRILLTTRMEITPVVLGVKRENIVALKELNMEECRYILKHYTFDDANKVIEDPELASIGEMTLHKIKRSPLAARLVGCLLKKNVCAEAWRRILNSHLLNETLDVILLSFQHLPPHLQRCFAICSLYPKGWGYVLGNEYGFYSINELARLWIALGYVEATDNESLEDKGRQYFHDLLSYSLFQSDPTRKDRYVMHDLVHDLTEMVSKNYCFRIEGDDNISIPATVIHLSIASGNFDQHITDILKQVSLRTFLILPSSDVKSFYITMEQTDAMFKKLTKLRVLLFGLCTLQMLNSSIGKLKHLRYLQFCSPKKLYESVANLCHLQFLVVPIFPRITFETEIPERLTCNNGLKHLKDLQQIRGSLTIDGLENVKNKVGAANAQLNKKRHLEEVKLIWNGFNCDDWCREMEITNNEVYMNRDDDVLEGLEPHPNLKRLEIHGYTGVKSPSWLLNNHLCNITSLHLSCCPKLIGIPNLPERLKEFEVQDCPELMQMPPFPCSLEKLSMNGCPGIEALLSSAISFDDDDGGEEHHNRKTFCIKSLVISGVSNLVEKTLNGFLVNNRLHSLSHLNLVKLPSITSLNLGPHLTALENLSIDDLEKLRSVNVNGFLEQMFVSECHKMESLPNLPSLKFLSIKSCSNIELLPSMPSSMRCILTQKCHPQLEVNYTEGGPLRHKISHIPEIYILK